MQICVNVICCKCGTKTGLQIMGNSRREYWCRSCGFKGQCLKYTVLRELVKKRKERVGMGNQRYIQKMRELRAAKVVTNIRGEHLSALSWNELRAYAKQLGVSAHRVGRAELEQRIKEVSDGQVV